MPAVTIHVPHVSVDTRFAVPLRPQAEALADIHAEVEHGFDMSQAVAEAGRCLNCDLETVFNPPLCIECKACEAVCPTDCITFTKDGEEEELRRRLKAPAMNLSQDLYVGSKLVSGRVMVKNEDICLHCGLCAQNCPTGAWQMQTFLLEQTHAGVPPAVAASGATRHA
jgi:ferredoxin